MNAQEARKLATEVTTTEQKGAIDSALSKIKWEAEHGHFNVTLYPHLPEFVKTYLEGRGYTVKLSNSGNQLDGPTLEVSW
ncbi:hypothetical protein [Deinococcus ruber]|uniref:Uncharacterized protein n=1 Tax=Deinococcus ruber TaxID=1848197 RepID=A0A918FES5_9DEIO|nr:hypothetical protein [Deinococcus ruber]GGR31354.1 hypothetical protein GCM10008957_47560 [Deinococcus ruber]